jgi:hypothetical protein
MQTYVVRVYRCADQPAGKLIGIVETSGNGPEQLAFTSLEELWAILRRGDCAEAAAVSATADQPGAP